MAHPHLRVLFDGELVRVETYRCRNAAPGRGREEWVSQPEIVFPRAGSFVRHDAGGTVVADPNHVLFFHPGQPYQISHPVPGGDDSTIFAVAPSAWLEMACLADPSMEDPARPPSLSGQAIVGTRERLRHHRLLQALIQEPELDPVAVEEQALTLLGEVIGLALEWSRRPLRSGPRTARAHPEVVNQAKLVLGEQFRRKLSIGEVARTVHASPYHLCRVFRSTTGLSIHGYLQRLRLLGVLEHLAEHPRADLTTLALDFGFSSSSHFSTAFRRAFGLAPSALRPASRALRQLSTNLKA